ncbi:toll/interleukin-1 receptor domain-containing protein [Komagataeibacter sp. FNDCF1]|uniref:toll/interleukin-1 receptor domain-containing protein n=1 Tax=Komagataeibacter sp. FNDCF1 TaxID=2878681 RepID=UPI001E3E12CB|nr:toll/interleukin-1 receptor domain-containing protein [Komagataeibacter sp. FNDCF1]MCE2564619.1 toll/interleukin-1 receptor domain-containing protein [Komagataeibacter sp. FNDCF1]
MYKAYSIVLDNKFSYRVDIESIKKNINPTIIWEDFFDGKGNILARDLIKKWFPSKKFHIFLSHSHKDENKAIELAEYLKDNFGLKVFIDSQIWQHADELLKFFDDKFCYNDASFTYDYAMRNITTSHVHNMLSVALTKMMDQCECVFFLNTENSIAKTIDESARSQTYSSWLYLEISNLNTLQIKPTNRPPMGPGLERLDKSFTVESSHRIAPKILYDIDLSFLVDLDERKMRGWISNYDALNPYCIEKKPEEALDILYYSHAMTFRRT